MNRSVYYRTSLVAFSVLTLIVLLGCFCWPSLPTLVHQGSCASIQAASPANGKAGAIPPARMKIAYIHGNDIWIMNNDGKENTQLTKTVDAEFSLSFARNPERIWFVRTTGVQGSTPYGDVYSCDLAGKNVKRITLGIKVRFATVSLDGKQLAISVISQLPDLNTAGELGDTADMWIINAENANQTESNPYINLTGDLPYTPGMGRDGSTFAAWSPTSKQVAFSYKGDSSASLGISTKTIYVADLDGSNRKEVFKSADEPDFDSQGTKIAAVTGGHWDTMGVVTASTEGTGLETVLPIAPGVTESSTLYSTYSPFWMTTFEDIATQVNVIYSRTTHPASPAEPVNTLERFNMDKKKTTSLVTIAGADKMITHASSDLYQYMIAFQVGGSNSPTGPNASIWTVKPDGSGLTQLTKGTQDSEPTWTADNSWWRTKGGTAKANACHWPYQNRTVMF
jgi:hypothetical protein